MSESENDQRSFVVSMPLSDDGKLVASLSNLAENNEHSLVILDARSSQVQMLSLNGFDRISEFANFLMEYLDVFLELEEESDEEVSMLGPLENEEVESLFQRTFAES